MNLREFMRFHLIKALLALVAIQIVIVAIVQNFNHRPQAIYDQLSIVEGRSIKILPLTNDMDKDENDELSLKQFVQPLHGSVEQNENILYYKPERGFAGIDSFTYTITDGHKESKNGIIRIEVKRNKAPVAHQDATQTYSGLKTTIDVLKNDSDPDEDTITIRSVSKPLLGSVIIERNYLDYSVQSNKVGIDSFTYIISDQLGYVDSATVIVTVKSRNDPCYPWFSSDVGDAALEGSFRIANGTLELTGSGSDIWNNFDGFRFAYQLVAGDCEMITRVDVLEGTNEWAKAGLMVRESLNGGSPLAFVCVSNRNGSTFHRRLNKNESMEGANTNSNAKAPYWIKINRKGNKFSFYDSPDGKTWNSLGDTEVELPKTAYVGFAFTSHTNSESGRAVFSNYRLFGKTIN